MSRPKLTLQEWCNDDQKIKMDFLYKESQNPHGLITRNQENLLISRDQINRNNYTSAKLANGLSLTITDSTFDKLKAKYRTFKKNLKDSGLVSKNYKLKKQTAEYIRSVKEENGWKREGDVIEDVINNIQNTEVNEKTITQLNTKGIRLDTLQKRIDSDALIINNLSKDKYLLMNEIYRLKDLLARAYLKNEFYTEEFKHRKISIKQPKITEETVRKKLLEIEYAFEAHL